MRRRQKLYHPWCATFCRRIPTAPTSTISSNLLRFLYAMGHPRDPPTHSTFSFPCYLPLLPCAMFRLVDHHTKPSPSPLRRHTALPLAIFLISPFRAHLLHVIYEVDVYSCVQRAYLSSHCITSAYYLRVWLVPSESLDDDNKLELIAAADAARLLKLPLLIELRRPEST